MYRRNPFPFRRRRLKLNELILGIDDLRLQSGDAAIDVRDLALDSRRVKAGSLFAALPGSKADGRSFVAAAAKAGASAILAPEGSTFADLPAGLAVVTAKEPRRALAQLAARFFGNQPLCIAAVTRSEEHTSELQSQSNLVCRLLLEKKKKKKTNK